MYRLSIMYLVSTARNSRKVHWSYRKPITDCQAKAETSVITGNAGRISISGQVMPTAKTSGKVLDPSWKGDRLDRDRKTSTSIARASPRRYLGPSKALEGTLHLILQT